MSIFLLAGIAVGCTAVLIGIMAGLVTLGIWLWDKNILFVRILTSVAGVGLFYGFAVLLFLIKFNV